MRSYFFLLLVVVCFTLSYSQDTTGFKKRDTVVIYKDPVILKKTVYYTDKAPAKKKIWMEFSLSTIFTSHSYQTCDSWQFYLDKIKESTSPERGGGGTVSLLFVRNNLYSSVGLGITSIKEKFAWSSSEKSVQGHNLYNYLQVPVSLGYSITGNRKLNVIPNAVFTAGYLLKLTGITLSEEYDVEIVNIRDVRKYYPLNYQAGVRCKLIYSVSDKVQIGAEPFWHMDIRSVIKSLEPFAMYRHYLGISGSLQLNIK